MTKAALIGLALIPASAAFAQPAANLSFDVASVKKADPPEPGRPMFMGTQGGPGSRDPSQITWSNATLKSLLTTAYDVKPYQVNGPDWIDTERYNITARVPPGATKEDVRVMWQNLLAERFGVTFHKISKVFQVQEMTAAKGGVKLKETTLDPAAANAPQPELPPPPAGRGGVQFSDSVAVGPGVKGGGTPAGPPDGPKPGAGPFGPPQLDKNGIPQLKAPGLIMMMTMGTSGPTARMVGKAQTTESLANMLGNQLNQPVVDKTGMTGKYDFVLEFAPEMGGRMMMPGLPGPLPGPSPGGETSPVPNAAEPNGATLVAALQQQLGLRLVASKSPLDVLVIDKAEKVPTEN
jgi:uncharacterized protein (TIGR03435 family)